MRRNDETTARELFDAGAASEKAHAAKAAIPKDELPNLSLSSLRKIAKELRAPGLIQVTLDADLEDEVRDLPNFTTRTFFLGEIGWADRFVFVLWFGPRRPGGICEVVVEAEDKQRRFLVIKK